MSTLDSVVLGPDSTALYPDALRSCLEELGRLDGQGGRLVDDLCAMLASRTLIDHAVGIVMAREHCGAEEAVELLRRFCQYRNISLRDLAAETVSSVGDQVSTTVR